MFHTKIRDRSICTIHRVSNMLVKLTKKIPKCYDEDVRLPKCPWRACGPTQQASSLLPNYLDTSTASIKTEHCDISPLHLAALSTAAPLCPLVAAASTESASLLAAARVWPLTGAAGWPSPSQPSNSCTGARTARVTRQPGKGDVVDRA
jgi:hypothetical protein